MSHHDDHAPHGGAAEVPAELLARHRHGWDVFTASTTKACVAVAVLLLLMLLFLRIL